MSKKKITLTASMAVWVLLTGVLLAACAPPNAASTPTRAENTATAASNTPTPSFSGRLTGSVTYRERIALDPQAEIEVRLLDVSKADAAAEEIAVQTFQADGRQVPVPFTLTYDPARIDPRLRYTLSARILVDGKLRWVSQQAYPVLTQGAPTDEVTIMVIATGEESSANELPQKELTLTAMTLDGEEVELEDDVVTTLQFSPDGRYSGSGGCNGYNGAYTLTGNDLALGPAAATRMACRTGMEQETKFFGALAQISAFETTAEGLRLSSADGKTTLSFSADSQSDDLTGVVWKWKESLDNSDKKTSVPNPDKYTLQFNSDGSTYFLADCNQGSGSYRLEGTSLTIEGGVTTLMACPPGSLDRQFLDELARVSSYLFDGDDLVLEWKFDSGGMRFIK